MIISHKMFRDLLFNNNKQIIGLDKTNDGNIRMNTVLIASLQQILLQLKNKGVNFTVDKNFVNFSIHNDNVGKSQEFKSANLFKAAIENAERRNPKYARYIFDLSVKITTKKDNDTGSLKEIFSYTINKVGGRPASSSVFSAISKYAADEKLAKQQAIFNQSGKEIIASVNTGNLTEIYKLAKDILNEGHNKFKNGKRYISGEQMYSIFQEVRANSDPFYMGGDILTEQIKSFLGACPSLTSCKTIKNSIENFYKALNKTDLKELK